MSDSYLPDNAPRDILLSLEELAARKLPHAPTFRKAAAEIERLRQLLSDTNTYYAECIAEREDLRAENEKLREALKPFADAVKDEFNWKYDINVDDFRAAAAAIRESGE